MTLPLNYLPYFRQQRVSNNIRDIQGMFLAFYRSSRDVSKQGHSSAKFASHLMIALSVKQFVMSNLWKEKYKLFWNPTRWHYPLITYLFSDDSGCQITYGTFRECFWPSIEVPETFLSRGTGRPSSLHIAEEASPQEQGMHCCTYPHSMYIFNSLSAREVKNDFL